MKTSEEIAKIAWATISLGNIARPANADEVVREMAPVLAEWQREIVEACARVAERWGNDDAADSIRALLPVRP